MLFDDNMAYLKGEKFNNGLSFKVPNSKLVFRNNYLVDIAKNKKILHVGFVDHIPLLDKKIEENKWLHNRLIEVSKFCIGVDINKDGINYLTQKYNIKNIYALDIVNDELPDEIKNEVFDYLLLPDVIEHIGNPVVFLKALKNRLPNVDKFIITTPNAFRWNNFINIFKNIECVNTDHRFWFTPYTLSKILIDSGFKLEGISFAEHTNKLSRRNIVKNLIIKKYPMFRDTIIMEVK